MMVKVTLIGYFNWLPVYAHNGVESILDKWNLALGQDVAAFIEKGLSKSHRVLCILL